MDWSAVRSKKDFTLPDYSQQTVGNEWSREKDFIILPKNIFNRGKKIKHVTF